MAPNDTIPGGWIDDPDDTERDGRRGSTVDAIAGSLARRITEGGFDLGEKLPPERALAEAFSASRGTVREALRSLETKGLVSRRVGSGTFVTYEREAREDDVAEITSPLELTEVRAAIEPQMVRLAVRNATARDIAALAETIRAMEACKKDPERFSAHDERFHIRLAEATRNPLMVEIYRRVNHVRTHEQWSSIKDKILTPARIAAYNAQHRELLAALARRDADRAVEIIEAHMARAHADLIATGG